MKSKFKLLTYLIISILFAYSASAVVSHSASEVVAGTFQSGNYIFQDDVNTSGGDFCITGGNCLSATGTGSVGGTGAANRVAFWTGSTTIDDDGNLTWDNSNKRLGIGTASPQQKLVVDGNINATGTVYGTSPASSKPGISGYASIGITPAVYGVSPSTTGRGVYGYASSTSGGNYGVYAESESTTGYAVFGIQSALSGTNYAIYATVGSSDGYSFYGTGGKGAKIASGNLTVPYGNVGIGTDTPGEELEVVGDVNSTGGDICITGGNCLSSVGTGTVGGTGAANRVAFWTGSTTIDDDNNLTWDNTNKRLGVGTDTPGEELEVVGAVLINASDYGEGLIVDDGSGLSEITGMTSFMMGYNCTSDDDYTVVTGTNSRASGANAVAMGQKALALGAHAVALGYNVKANGGGSVAMGSSATALQTADVALGNWVTASGGSAVAMGNNAYTSGGSGSLSIGYHTTVTGSNSIALGRYAKTSGLNSFTWGYSQCTSASTSCNNTQNNMFAVYGNFSVNNGNVGIGTDTPQQDLVVVGNANVTGTLWAHNYSSQSPIVFINASGDELVRFNDDGGVGIGGTADSVTSLKVQSNKYYAIKVDDSYSAGGGIAVDVGMSSSSSTSGIGIRGQSAGNTGIGVKGRAYHASGITYGLYGEVVSVAGYSGYFTGGKGVYIATGDFGVGATPSSYSSKALVWATSDTIGLRARNTMTSSAIGLQGESTASTSGYSYGVYGYSADDTGRGIYGYAALSSGINYGVYGLTNSADGHSGYFSGGRGVYTSCPSGFTAVYTTGTSADNERQLGCIQTNKYDGNHYLASASDYCFDNYGGRLPSVSEFYNAAANLALTNENTWIWMDDIQDTSYATISRVDGTNLYIDRYGITDTNSDVDTRCWVET